MKLFWLIGRMVDWLCISGMHGAAFFALGQGGAEETVVRWDKAGQGAKSSGWGRATVKLGAFSGWDGAVLKFSGPRWSRETIFLGAGHASLLYMYVIRMTYFHMVEVWQA